MLTGLSMMGKLGVSGAYNSVYLMTGELFPTGARNLAMGMSSNVARIGGALSPYIADLVSENRGLMLIASLVAKKPN